MNGLNTAKEPQVWNKLNRLESAVTALNEIVLALEDRLSKVVQPQLPEPCGVGGNIAKDELLVSLAASIQSNLLSVEQSNARLRSLLQRLEV